MSHMHVSPQICQEYGVTVFYDEKICDFRHFQNSLLAEWVCVYTKFKQLIINGSEVFSLTCQYGIYILIDIHFNSLQFI